MSRAIGLLTMVCGLTLLGPARGDDPAHADDEPVRVTVVVIVATTEQAAVDKKLTGLAVEVQKRAPELVGFKLNGTLQKSIPVGGSHTFDLLEGQKLTVRVDQPKDKTGRLGLTVTLPGGDEVSYTCVCDKFLPLVTSHKTKDGGRLIVAVGAKPCTGKGP